MSKSERREIVFASITTVIMTVMNISGLPATLFVNLSVLDIQPFYFALMVNFVLTALVFFVMWKVLYPAWCFGLSTKGLGAGIKKYGISCLVICALSTDAFIVGLLPFDNSPSVAKVIIEGFVYYIGVAFIEELYIRGLLQNIIEKLFYKKRNASSYAIVLASLIFGIGHIFGVLGSSPLTIICKVVWTIALGLYLGAIYKRTGNLWVPIILHTVIDFCAWPFCYSTLPPYPQISLGILLVIYTGLGVYAYGIMRNRENRHIKKDSNVNFDELYAIMLKTSIAQFNAMPKNHKEVSLEELSGYMRGKFPNGKPIEFIQTSGNAERKPDLIVPSSLGWMLFHKSLIELFTEKGFTGWESYPIKIFCKNGEVNEDYHAFIVKGVCGHYDVKKSEIIDYTADNGGFILREKRYLGMYFDEKTWDGSDIFGMEHTWWVIVTQPVACELKRLKAKVKLIRLSEHLLLDKVEE